MLGGANDGWRLRKGAQEKQRFVEADQRWRIKEVPGVETIQQLYDACGLVGSETIAAGFEFGQPAVQGFGRHVWGQSSLPHAVHLMRR